MEIDETDASQWVNKYKKLQQEELLQQIRTRPRSIIGLVNGHYPLRVHLNKIGLHNVHLSCTQRKERTKTTEIKSTRI